MFDLIGWWRNFTKAPKWLKTLSVLAVLLLLFSVAAVLRWSDIAMLTVVQGAEDEWLLTFSVCTAASVTFLLGMAVRYRDVMKRTAAIIEMQPEIDETITRRWEMVWDGYGIDPDEPRAEITSFPLELELIQTLEAARKRSKVRATRRKLGAHVLTIMHGCLGLLAYQFDVYEMVGGINGEGVAEEEARLA